MASRKRNHRFAFRCIHILHFCIFVCIVKSHIINNVVMLHSAVSAVFQDSCSQVLNLGSARTSLPSGDDCHLSLICLRNHFKAQKMLVSCLCISFKSAAGCLLCRVGERRILLPRRGQQLSVHSCCV